MDFQQRCTQLIQELFQGIDAGDFANAESIPDRYTYAHLWALFLLADQLDGGKVLYEQLYDLAIQRGKLEIQHKIREGSKIKVAFLAISAAEWPTEEVYRLFEKDGRCECYAVVAPLLYDRAKECALETYRQTCDFLKQSGHDVREIYDAATERSMGWEKIGGMPDIVIHLMPWYQAMLTECQIENFPLKCINCYIPYGMYVADSADKEYSKMYTYNKTFMNFCFRIYTDSYTNLQGYQIYELLRGKNARYSGYSKMDYFYEKRKFEETELRKIWKMPAGTETDKIKKVIIAPHHTLLPSAGIAFATFQKNMYFWIYLAKKYADRVSFIFKPHPHLRARVVRAQVFESLEMYDAYLAEWNKLPNAKAVMEEDYRDIFASSDGMIMDSCSFIGEYLYVNKPLLFLKRNGQAFNSLGEKIIEAHYTEWGEDYMGIENFLQSVILEGRDTKKEEREKIFHEELDYYAQNGCGASEYIYRDLCHELLEVNDMNSRL